MHCFRRRLMGYETTDRPRQNLISNGIKLKTVSGTFCPCFLTDSQTDLLQSQPTMVSGPLIARTSLPVT